MTMSNPHYLAMTMIRDVLKNTGITATAGIGTNLYLAKVAMDIVAKKAPPDKDGVRIAELDEMSYRMLLWCHRPLTAFWQIGPGKARRLAKYGIYTFSLGAASVTILHCWPEAWTENDMSIVLRIDYGSSSFLFTGYAEEMSEFMMMEAGVPLYADVLKVAHHGSRWSTTPEFVDAVHPTWAVISCGEGNAYGHPHEEVLRALEGAKILRTDELGTISFHSDGTVLSVAAIEESTIQVAYIGNRKTMKFHRPECDSIADMAEANKVPLGSREDAIRMGYVPCGRCKP